jgi:hypothetical protein
MHILIRLLFPGVVLFWLLAPTIRVTAQAPSIDPVLAEKYLREADALCHRDAGRLWGISLCGPIIFIDPNSRAMVANQADREGLLVKNGEVYVGRWPEDKTTANTAIDWAGKKWTTVQWPLPTNKYARARLMVHELFHRIQDRLNLPASNPTNSHLDSLEGRILLQLEWLALREAVTHQGAERKRAITDALVFRFRRHEIFPLSKVEERQLEMNEGLAEYTGARLSGRTMSELPGYIASRLDLAPNRTTFVRSFAYETGPAYGFLLDQLKPGWRVHLKKEDDLSSLMQVVLPPKSLRTLEADVQSRALAYDGDNLRATETARDNARQSALKEYRAKLVDGPVLTIPLSDDVNYSFDPNNLQPLGDLGTVYPTIKVSDVWGVLTVTGGGALMDRKNNRASNVHVSAPANLNISPLAGDGWKLELKAGWKIQAAERKGNYVIRKDD